MKARLALAFCRWAFRQVKRFWEWLYCCSECGRPAAEYETNRDCAKCEEMRARAEREEWGER